MKQGLPGYLEFTNHQDLIPINNSGVLRPEDRKSRDEYGRFGRKALGGISPAVGEGKGTGIVGSEIYPGSKEGWPGSKRFEIIAEQPALRYWAKQTSDELIVGMRAGRTEPDEIAVKGSNQ